MSNKFVTVALYMLIAIVSAFFIASLIVYTLKTVSVQTTDVSEGVNHTNTNELISEPEKSVDMTSLVTRNQTKIKRAQIDKVLNTEILFPPATNKKASLGINTNEVFEQDASIPFVDLFRVATPFHENIRCRQQDKPCLSSAEVEYDNNGWPSKLNGAKAGVFFLRNIAIAALPEGDYKVLYDGEGDIEYLQNIELIARNKGNDTIRFNAREDGFMTAALQVVESNPDNPLKNIRILMPGGICQSDPFTHVSDASSCQSSKFLDFERYYTKIIFNPDYLNFMKDFGVLRFMPMSGITRNPLENWEQRNTLEKATWGGIYGSRGAPLEIQLELANRLKADPWLNVPHAANDEYMREFASMVKRLLSPDLTPHIEYTNEAWNANFVHNEYMQKMGIAQKLDQDALLAGYKYYAKRSVEFFSIWQTVYGENKNFVRIIGGWDTRPDISAIILAYNDTYKAVDALAIAPYIGGNLRGFRESKNVDDIFRLLNDKKSYRSLPKIFHELEKHADLAKSFGVSLMAYEGGQGLVDWAAKDYLQHPNPLFYAANRDTRMNDLYLDLYSQWRAMGADLFVAFSAPRSCNWSGCWGLKEHIRQNPKDAPKLQASLVFMNQNKKWWDGSAANAKDKPASSRIASYLKATDPKKPRIVIRPATGDTKKEKNKFYRFENPQALNLLLAGKTWDKRDISGKWQVKWDETNIYLSVKVYDKEKSADSTDPRDDDSIEFFIDGNNSRGHKFDNKNDFQIIFARDKAKVTFGKSNPQKRKLDIPFEIEEKYDGYELRAEINWKQLGLTPRVKDMISMDVVVNDDDDGGARDARISWNTRNITPAPKDFGMILISGR
jgi:hypothetical protein